MKAQRIYFQVFGKGAHDLSFAAYAVKRGGETNLDAVKASIARTTGAHIVNCLGGGYEPPSGLEVYQVTLGRHSIERLFTALSGQGTTEIIAEFWVKVPVEGGQSWGLRTNRA